jgi:predicted aminopeptidase
VKEKRAGKARLFQEMKDEYQRLKVAWGGYSGYDWIFSQNINNAFVVSTALYTQLVPAFQALLARSRGNMQDFYQATKMLAEQSRETRKTSIAALMRGGGSATAVAAPAR